MTKSKKWEARPPKPPKNKDRKRCYYVLYHDNFFVTGPIVWLTDKELTFHRIRDPNLHFEEILEKDLLALYERDKDNVVK